MVSLIAAIAAYPWGIAMGIQRSQLSSITTLWLVLDFVPPVLACVLGADVLWQRWMRGRTAASAEAVFYAAAGLILGALWMFVAFSTSPSLLPIRQ